MSDTGYTIIAVAMLVLSMLLMRLIGWRFLSWLDKAERYQRRKERYNKIMERQKDRFLFKIKNDKTTQKKDNHQILTLKGWYSRPLILQISFKNRSDINIALSPPIEKINSAIRRYQKDPNVIRIVASFMIYSKFPIEK